MPLFLSFNHSPSLPGKLDPKGIQALLLQEAGSRIRHIRILWDQRESLAEGGTLPGWAACPGIPRLCQAACADPTGSNALP